MGHGEAFGGANCGAKPAETTLGHVNIKLGGIQPNRRPIGGFSNFFRRANWLNFNAINGTNLSAFVTHNAIIHLVVELVAGVVG